MKEAGKICQFDAIILFEIDRIYLQSNVSLNKTYTSLYKANVIHYTNYVNSLHKASA